NRRPALGSRAVATHAEAANTEVARELEVGVAIANHRARCQVHGLLTHVRLHELRLRLAALAVVGLEMRANEDRIELDALRAEGFQYEVVSRVELVPGKARRAETVLIRDHHEA